MQGLAQTAGMESIRSVLVPFLASSLKVGAKVILWHQEEHKPAALRDK